MNNPDRIQQDDKMRRYKNDKDEDRSFSLLGFFFQSKAAVLIIAANVACFWFIVNGDIKEEVVKQGILFPGNLFAGNFLCVITSGFIHFDLMHLAFNMLGVFVFARIVEKHLGFVKTMFVYFGALIIAMLFATVCYYFVLHKNIAIIGASGAVMGLISAAMLLDPFCITYEMILPLPVIVKGWMFFVADIKGFLGAEKDGVSHLTHLFGFFSIGILVYFLSRRDKAKLTTGLIINIVSLVAFYFVRNWLITRV